MPATLRAITWNVWFNHWHRELRRQAGRHRALAARAGESFRSFHRNFAAATGKSPAAFVALQRIDRARSLILEGLPLKQVAERTGYADVTRLSAAFQRALGMTANDYRIVHAGSTSSPTIPANPNRFLQPQP